MIRLSSSVSIPSYFIQIHLYQQREPTPNMHGVEIFLLCNLTIYHFFMLIQTHLCF